MQAQARPHPRIKRQHSKRERRPEASARFEAEVGHLVEIKLGGGLASDESTAGVWRQVQAACGDVGHPVRADEDLDAGGVL